ncbi:MAG: cation transporter [Holophaga sp.]|jgi:copper chaperone
MVRLKIQGMSCQHCVTHVREALSAVEGVSGPVEVSLERGEAIVPGSADSKALVAALAAAVEEAGYSAVPVP